jgi:hypothetical protein
VIGALSLQANDTICRFDTVKRKGNEVTWRGDCDGEKTKVVAFYDPSSKLLDVKIGEQVYVNLKRCKKGGSANSNTHKCPKGKVAFTWKNGQKDCVRKSVYEQARKNCAQFNSPPEGCLCEDGGNIGACGD